MKFKNRYYYSIVVHTKVGKKKFTTMV